MPCRIHRADIMKKPMGKAKMKAMDQNKSEDSLAKQLSIARKEKQLSKEQEA